MPTKKKRSTQAQTGREQSTIVRKYLLALEELSQIQRTRQSVDRMQERLQRVDAKIEATADPLQRLELVQQRNQLSDQIAKVGNGGINIEELEERFIAVAKDFGDRKGIQVPAWREVGVPAPVLRRAGYAIRGRSSAST